MLEVRRPAGQAACGLGWLMMPVHGREIVWHNGATAGFRSFVGYSPLERMGIVLLSNASTALGVDDIGFHLLNQAAPLASPEPPTEHTAIQLDPALLANYTGRYQVTPNLIFEITREGDRLFAQGLAQLNGQTMALPEFELFAETGKSFFASVADHQITFETGSDGRATGLILHKAGRNMPAPRLDG